MDGGEEEGDILINKLDLTALIPAPATGETPETSISTDQYTGTIAWLDDEDRPFNEDFAPETAYTATLTLTVESGYTFSGLAVDKFIHSATPNVTAPISKDGITTTVTLIFLDTGKDGDTRVDALALGAEIPTPVFGGTPKTTIDQDQYAGTITWETETYTATVALTAKSGYTFSGLGTTSFTHSGASSISAVISQDGTTVTITIVFPPAPEPSATAKEAFLAFVTAVNEDGSLNFELEGDIDLADQTSFAPIGSKTNPYTGTFDGKGHHIYNLNISAEGSFVGLFAVNAGTIKNLEVTGTVTGTGGDPNDYVGGIAGYNKTTGTIQDVTAHITVTASNVSNVGGIAGFNGCDTVNTNSPDYVAGSDSDRLAAYQTGGAITRCLNTGDVTGRQKVGGIAGENAGTISLCANYGDITATLASGGACAGGIAGRNGNNNACIEKGIIENCYNPGATSVGNARWEGGITGWRNDFSIVENCYTVGTITTAYADYAPIVARQDSNSGTYQTGNCYGTSLPKNTHGGYCRNNYSLDRLLTTNQDEFYKGIVKTEEELKDPAFLTDIGNAFATDSNNINNGYPVLAWQNN
jgi:hypothetical protein